MTQMTQLMKYLRFCWRGVVFHCWWFLNSLERNNKIIISVLTTLTCMPVSLCSAGVWVFDETSCRITGIDCVWASRWLFCVDDTVAEKLSRVEINVRVSVDTCRESSSGGRSKPLARSWNEINAAVSVDVSWVWVLSFIPQAVSLRVIKLKVSVATGRVDGFGGGLGGSLENRLMEERALLSRPLLTYIVLAKEPKSLVCTSAVFDARSCFSVSSGVNIVPTSRWRISGL